MTLPQIYAVLWVLGCVAETLLLGMLIARRHYRRFPIFTLYVAFNVATDLGMAAVQAGSKAMVLQRLMFFVLLLTYVLQLGVLLEIGWNVLRPVRASLPQGIIRVFAAIMVLCTGVAAITAWHFDSSNGRVSELKDPLDLTFSVLCMLVFVLIASFAQVLGVGWKSKVLQLATGLSFYSAVDLAISVAERMSGRYSTLEPIHAVAYVLEMGFLIYAFTTKDVDQREFSPQMEQFLVTLAGRAKLARTALVRMQVK